MNVAVWVWIATIGGLLALLAVDLFVVDYRPHRVTIREAARWVVGYVALAALFGAGVAALAGQRYAGQFFAGYLTEYSLSIDNLFVFVVVVRAFAVPEIQQHKVLLFGVLIALLLRGFFIAAGAAAITTFDWVFYLFGGFLGYTAVRLARSGTGIGIGKEREFEDNAVLRLVRRAMPVTEGHRGSRVFLTVDGKRRLTPMLVVMVAIGTTDLLFALDSIPAIFGLTREPYLVFTANAFALMGLRQLYFLLGGLLDRLVYLSAGLSVILAFIGVKLVLEALHGNDLPFLNGGRPLPVPEMGTWLSLGVVMGVLAVATVASLLKVRRDPAAVCKRG